jgi:hypothetical protein
MTNLHRVPELSALSNRYAARLAGAMYLVLIVAVLASSTLLGGSGSDITKTFRTISDNATGFRIGIAMLVVAAIATVVLATMLRALTKSQDEDLATLALACRVVEAALYAVQIFGALILLSLHREPTAGARQAGAVVIDVVAWSSNVGAAFFAVGCALFAYLLLKGRLIPVPLAALGVVASLILVVAVPLETAASRSTVVGGFLVLWLPMFVFEIATGAWLLVKGGRLAIPGTA